VSKPRKRIFRLFAGSALQAKCVTVMRGAGMDKTSTRVDGQCRILIDFRWLG
jgi:hypothetical protein